jgi:hypothetical protein
MQARDNPFRSERIETLRYRFEGDSWEGLLARLAALGYRAAIVGPHGSGKTTLLEELEARLKAAGFNTRRTLPRRPDPGDILLLDSAGLLSPHKWFRIRRRATRAHGLVITDHRSGRLPTLIRCGTSPALLRELVSELGPVPHDLDALHAKHCGDVRRVLRELYDRCAGDSS